MRLSRRARLPALGLLCAAAAALAGLALSARSPRPAAAATLLQLRPGAPASARLALRNAGASLVASKLRLWRLPAGRAPVVARLRARGAVAFTERERLWPVAAVTDAPTDPLVGEEWWRAAVRVDTLTPPGPGMPVTLVDSGVYLGHPEFAGRPNLIALNTQEPQPIGGVHGTAVASVVAAPQNGVGLVGIYPQAVLRTYDASLGDGTRLPTGEIVRGILAAAGAGRSVINLSLGGGVPSPSMTAAVDEAVRSGSLVVAASGNSGDEGNGISYPGATPHVLTVGATGQDDLPAPFTTRSPFVDLAAPGVDIPVADALESSWEAESGTSFAAPLVSGAAAWLWTVRPDLDAGQVAEILRRSARDVPPAGYDQATGYGILDVAAALAAPTPTRDTPEPNDANATATTATTRGRPNGAVSGRVLAFDDPRDVFRVWLPARKRLTVTARSPGGVAVSLLGMTRSGTTATLAVRNGRAGRDAFLVVRPASGVRDTDYSLAFRVR